MEKIKKPSTTNCVIFCIVALIVASSLFQISSQESFFLVRPLPFELDKCHADIVAPVIDATFWRENRGKLISKMSARHGQNEAVLLHGRPDSVGNSGIGFVQDPDFTYVSGVMLPSASLIIALDTGLTTLFLTNKTAREIAFDGPFPSLEALRNQHGIDAVKPAMDLLEQAKSFSQVHVLNETAILMKDSTAFVSSLLRSALDAARRTKTEAEINLIRYVTKISALAHVEVFKRATVKSSEYSLMAMFTHLTFLCGSRVQAYSPIVAANENGGILHYQATNEETASRHVDETSTILIDASGSFKGYASDITRTWPVLTWPENGRLIYGIVLKANLAGIQAVTPGVGWSEVYAIARNVLLEGLLEAGFVYGTVEQLINSGVDKVFMPHGLGHTYTFSYGSFCC